MVKIVATPRRLPLTAGLQDRRGRASRLEAMRRVVLLVLAVFLFVPVAVAQDEGTLRDRIGDGKSRERSLASAADRLGELERKATREVVILEGRLGAAQQDLNEAETRLAATEARETAARRRVARLRKRL